MVEVMKGIEPPFIVCVSSGKKCSFLGTFGVLCLLETPVLRFALLSHYLNDLCIWQCNPTPGFFVAKLFGTNRRRGERRLNDAFKYRISSNKCFRRLLNFETVRRSNYQRQAVISKLKKLTILNAKILSLFLSK